MFWNQLGLTPEELCSVSWGIFMRCHMHIHTSINNICIRILCRCNWAQYGHQDFQSATGGLMCHSGCQWCIPKNHYKLLCHYLDWSWRLSGIYLKITTNIYVFFSGSLEDLLLDPLVFVVTLYPGWGCTFVVIFFFGLGMENVVIGVGQSYFTATKSWPNSPPQIPTPIQIVQMDPNST